MPSSECASKLQNTLSLLNYLLGNSLRISNVPIVNNVPIGTISVANQLPIAYNLPNQLPLPATLNNLPISNAVNCGNLAGVPIANNLQITNVPVLNNGLNRVVNLGPFSGYQNGLTVVPNSNNNYRIRKRTYLVNNRLLQNRPINVPINNSPINYQAANLPITSLPVANNGLQLNNFASIPTRNLAINYQNGLTNLPVTKPLNYLNRFTGLPINNQITKLPVQNSGCTCARQLPVPANNVRYNVPVVPYNTIANLPVVNGMPVIRVSEKVYKLNV